jgi:alanine racemase
MEWIGFIEGHDSNTISVHVYLQVDHGMKCFGLNNFSLVY